MDLKQFLRLICDISTNKGEFYPPDYETGANMNKRHFKVPFIHCKDGFGLSIQINCHNYCSSENGYREYGKEWIQAEWGFTTVHEPMLNADAEDKNNTTQTVGYSDVTLLQAVIDAHGGFDWDKINDTCQPTQ